MSLVKVSVVNVLFFLIMTIFCASCDLKLEDDPYSISKINGFWKINAISVEQNSDRNSCMVPQSVLEAQRVLESGLNIYLDFVDGTAQGYCEYHNIMYVLDGTYSYEITNNISIFKRQDDQSSTGIFQYIFKEFTFEVTEEKLDLVYDISFISDCKRSELIVNTRIAERSLMEDAIPANDDILTILQGRELYK